MYPIIFAATDPSPTPSDIGQLVINIAFILLFLERAIALVRFFWPNKPTEITVHKAKGDKDGDDYATKADIISLEEKITKYATKEDIGRVEKQMTELTADYKDLLKTSFERYDGMNKLITELRVGQERLHLEVRDEINRAVVLLIGKIEEAAKLASESHRPEPKIIT